MQIKTYVLDKDGKPYSFHSHSINPKALIEIAKNKASEVKEKGANWAFDGVPVFAKEYIKAVENGEDERTLEMASVSMVQMLWLAESIFLGLSEEKFINSDLEFTIQQDGTVIHKRHEHKVTH
ncbi:hypothetical protein SM14VA4_18660 [Serratia marcescens]|nr:hypothetical protein SM14VA4_18300 [Serratia marcescens]BEM04267.1 hypothetical protein SM14VA4_18390 [Serratia marcescens]BEM04276.1 hypothetical protein SM14VA4_18480 [Serratia marcescens]BEM04285.1 hypothetical protein SM14VA4_18570 [Serratia marcescens]BEM04294.1 hypothetical protein SM14VA4_18660 [Serratia marcescens]